MAYANIEDKRRSQREWRKRKRREDAEWHEREKAAKRAYGRPEFEGLRGHETRAKLNEKRWRFQMWEVARMQPELLANFTIINSQELTQPIFVFVEPSGRRRMENLCEPLPTW